MHNTDVNFCESLLNLYQDYQYMLNIYISYVNLPIYRFLYCI